MTTPGVRFEWLNPSARTLGLTRTDVAGFVGIADRGPLHTPVRVTSWTQFTGAFGGHTTRGFLAYAVAGFFACGGQVCWVVRVADPESARAAEAGLDDRSGRTALRLTAADEGTWGDRLRVTVRPAADARFTLLVRLPGGAGEQWRDLSLRPGHPRFAATVLNAVGTGSRLVRAEVPELGTPPLPVAGLDELAPATVALAGGADGIASLGHRHFTGEQSEHSTGEPGRAWGLAALGHVDEVSVVAVPDASGRPVPPPLPEPAPPPAPGCRPGVRPAPGRAPAHRPAADGAGWHPAPPDVAVIQQALIAHCERLGDRVAVLDPPAAGLSPAGALAWAGGVRSEDGFAAGYYPWLLVGDPLRPPGAVLAVPPSGHVAGVYALGDRAVGVHKPPANAALASVVAAVTEVDDADHGRLNADGLNVIRAYPGRGVRVMGARTLSHGTTWRYVNVRRLLLMIAEMLDEQTQWVVFEPAEPATWRSLDRVVRAVLDSLWTRGMLDGATAAEAYGVRCDETTNPPQETASGRVVCLAGVRPPAPAEFVVLRLGRTEAGLDVAVATGAGDDQLT